MVSNTAELVLYHASAKYNTSFIKQLLREMQRMEAFGHWCNFCRSSLDFSLVAGMYKWNFQFMLLPPSKDLRDALYQFFPQRFHNVKQERNPLQFPTTAVNLSRVNACGRSCSHVALQGTHYGSPGSPSSALLQSY